MSHDRLAVKNIGCTTSESDVDGNDILVTLGWRQLEDLGGRINMLMTLLLLKSIINISNFSQDSQSRFPTSVININVVQIESLLHA